MRYPFLAPSAADAIEQLKTENGLWREDAFEMLWRYLRDYWTELGHYCAEPLVFEAYETAHLASEANTLLCAILSIIRAKAFGGSSGDIVLFCCEAAAHLKHTKQAFNALPQQDGEREKALSLSEKIGCELTNLLEEHAYVVHPDMYTERRKLICH